MKDIMRVEAVAVELPALLRRARRATVLRRLRGDCAVRRAVIRRSGRFERLYVVLAAAFTGVTAGYLAHLPSMFADPALGPLVKVALLAGTAIMGLPAGLAASASRFRDERKAANEERDMRRWYAADMFRRLGPLSSFFALSMVGSAALFTPALAVASLIWALPLLPVNVGLLAFQLREDSRYTLRLGYGRPDCYE